LNPIIVSMTPIRACGKSWGTVGFVANSVEYRRIEARKEWKCDACAIRKNYPRSLRLLLEDSKTDIEG